MRTILSLTLALPFSVQAGDGYCASPDGTAVCLLSLPPGDDNPRNSEGDFAVLMYARTDRGRQWYLHSADGGKTFDKGEPSPLWGPLSPATVKRLKSGDLIAIWNDHENRPDLAKAGPSWAHGLRTPLTLAISRDEGKTWTNRRTLLDDPKGWYCYSAILERDRGLLLGVATAWGLSQSGIFSVQMD